MEHILEIDVKMTGYEEVKGHDRTAAMLSFTGTAKGPCFSGSVIGSGVDTQKTDRNGVTALSARYILEGTDSAGQPCRIFIENNSDGKGGFTPVIVTDSEALAYLERSPLKAEITPSEEGVIVDIFIP